LAPPPCWKLLLGFFSLHILLLFFQPPGLLFLNTFLQVIAKRWGNTWTLSSRISLLHPQTLHRWFFSSPMALNTQKCWLLTWAAGARCICLFGTAASTAYLAKSLFFLSFFFCSMRVWTENFTLARQALYYTSRLAMAPVL
jgi:hypothetical protein